MINFMLVFLGIEPPPVSNADLVSLNSQDYFPSVTVMGWGDTDMSSSANTLSDVLMNVNVDVISNQACDAARGYRRRMV